jgi:hypothetical protein
MILPQRLLSSAFFMVFKGRKPIGSKTVIDNMILEQMNTFTHLGHNISYKEEKYIIPKSQNFFQILGLLNTLKPSLVQRSTRLKLYKTFALPTLLYGSEIWTLNNVTKIGFKTEIKYLQQTAG